MQFSQRLVIHLSCIKWSEWRSLSRVRLFATLHGILQSRTLQWVAFPFSRCSFQPRDPTQVSCIAGRFFISRAKGKPWNTGVGSLSLLQRIFPTHESNRNRTQVSCIAGRFLPTELWGKLELYTGGKLKTLNEKKILLYVVLGLKKKRLWITRQHLKPWWSLFCFRACSLLQPSEKTMNQNINCEYLWVGNWRQSFVCQNAFF